MNIDLRYKILEVVEIQLITLLYLYLYNRYSVS